MSGPRQRDRSKERFWRRLVRLQQRSSATVREFCAEHGVSAPSFYAWKRTIAQRDQACSRQDASAAETARPLFVALGNLATPAPFELLLANDRVLRIPVGFDPRALRQLLAALDEDPAC